MGIGRKWEPGQAQVDERTVRNGDEEGHVVQHQERKPIESRKGNYRDEIETLQGRDAGLVYLEKYVPFPEEKKRRAIQLQPKSENFYLDEEDYKTVFERPKSSNDGKDFIASNCQDVNRADSRSKSTYVKLWAKESQRNDQTPKRIKVQIGSLSCGDTVRFLEAEKARVIGEIQEEQDKILGCGRDAKVLIGTRDKASKEVEDTNGMAMYIVDDSNEGQALRPMTGEHKKAEDIPADIKEQPRTDRDQSSSQELRSLSISEGKVKQRTEKELRATHENKAQLEAKTTRGIAQEEKLTGVHLRGQGTLAREQTHTRGQKPTSTRPPFDTVKKIDRRAVENSRDSKGYKPFRDKSSGRFDNYAVGSAEADKGRAIAKQGGVDDEKELQKKALFHLDALKRIEETYNKRKRKEKLDYLREKRANEMVWYHPGCHRDHNYSTEFHETQANQCRIPQNRGKGGLNALLAPVFEDELERQFHVDGNSPTNSDTDKQVAIFQRIKKARLKAAQEQIAAAKARGQQIRAQWKGRPENAEKAKTPEREVLAIKERNIDGEYFKPPKDNLPPNQHEGRFLTYTPSAKRIKTLNEKARAEAEIEQERRIRAKMKEERTAGLRKGHDNTAVELYGRLNRDERRAKMGPNIGYKSPLDTSQKSNGFSRFKNLQLSPQCVNRRFKSPPASPRKAMKANALEHFANWEKELRSAQRSNSRSKERSRERKVTIVEDPTQNSAKRKSPVPKSGSAEKGLISNKQSPRSRSPMIVLSSEPIPDHYSSSVGRDCTCDLRQKKDKRRMKDVKSTESPKGSRRKEACKSLNWLGKLYNTITSFS